MNRWSETTRRCKGCRIPSAQLVFFLTLALMLFAPHDARAQGSPSSSAKPTAQSAQERDDYRAATAATGGAGMLHSAREFAKKYPKSTLRPYLYQRALRQYQMENDADGVRTAVAEVLAIDPGD